MQTIDNIYNEIVRVIKIIDDTTVDGIGFRTSIYFAGCEHHCEGCHNSSSWDINAGEEWTILEILERIKNIKYNNVTFTGGDPLYQYEKIIDLVHLIRKETEKTIWLYTGFTYEEILRWKNIENLLKNIECIVDGKFEIDRKGYYKFRGSKNQRIIDVQKSLKENKIILWEDSWEEII